jgi:hypothetical protein
VGDRAEADADVASLLAKRDDDVEDNGRDFVPRTVVNTVGGFAVGVP